MSTLVRHAPSTVAEVASIVRDAASAGRALRIRGAGTWMDAGGAVPAEAELSLGAFTGITSYRPEDLTLSVGAGTTLAELDAVTRAHGQWCPLLPWGDDAGTVGATIATATTGPFAARLGRPANLALGLECVDGTGRVIASGGRVVKNVAGFDLTRAVTGAWGTLAVITQVHLRLRARPVVDETWALTAPDATALLDAVDARVLAFANGPFAPLACTRIAAVDVLAADAPEAADARWLVRIGGNATLVAAARAALRTLGEAREVDVRAWDSVRARLAPPARALNWRWDALSLRLRERFDPARVLNRGLLGEPA